MLTIPYRVTVLEEGARVALFCQAKKEHSGLVPQELAPWGIGRQLTVRTHDQEYVIMIKIVTVLHSSDALVVR